MAEFVCLSGWATQCPDVGSRVVLSVSGRVHWGEWVEGGRPHSVTWATSSVS